MTPLLRGYAFVQARTQLVDEQIHPYRPVKESSSRRLHRPATKLMSQPQSRALPAKDRSANPARLAMPAGGAAHAVALAHRDALPHQPNSSVVVASQSR